MVGLYLKGKIILTRFGTDVDGRMTCIDCPHAHYSDSGNLCCRLFDPYVSEDKVLVKYGTCGANTDCSYKLRLLSEQKLEQNEKEMNKIIIRDKIILAIALLVLLLFIGISKVHAYGEAYPYNNNWYIRSDKNEYANRDRKYFDPPAVGETAKEPNKIQRILYRANKRHPLVWERYDEHLSNREYTDCSYYKYVDCSNLSFCRCWQCRDYVYAFQWEE